MPSYRFLDYELSEADFCLSRGGQRISLEPKALRVLTLLVSRAGRLVDKQELLDSVWPNTFVEENTLTRTVAILRRELGDTSRDSKMIETVPTRGYRFIAAVETLAPPVTLPAPEKTQHPPDELDPTTPAVPLQAGTEAGLESPPRTPRRLWRPLLLGLSAAAILLGFLDTSSWPSCGGANTLPGCVAVGRFVTWHA